MKKIKFAIFSLKILLFIVIISLSFSFVQKKECQLTYPQIKLGNAKIFGKVTKFNTDIQTDSPIIYLLYPNAITAEKIILKTTLNKDGSFFFEVPLETNFNIGVINSEIFENYFLVELSIGKETKVEITHNETGKIEVMMNCHSGLTPYDATNFFNHGIYLMHMPLNDAEKLSENAHKLTPENYIQDVLKKNLEKRLAIIEKDSTFSEFAKNYIINDFKLQFMKSILLDYKNVIIQIHKFHHPEDSTGFTPQELKKSYYSFLKYFDLNNPQYLYSIEMLEVTESILSNKTLNIPVIDDTPIDLWLSQVKSIMTDLIGTDRGLFYELLIAGAYVKQFNYNTKRLSKKQKENIKNYTFENKNIQEILFAKNEIVKEIREEKLQPIINKTPFVSKEQLLDSIIAKYKGKVVIVDFWATWCAPCMANMKEFKKIKIEMSEKDIVFVYITDISSPKALWEEKIGTIWGEHYYLTQDEWKYLMDNFGFNGIPSYLIYDSQGTLKHKFTGDPGTEKIQKLIEELLP